MFSTKPLAELDELVAAHDADRAKRHAQRELAVAMTSWVHGAASIPRVESASKIMFGGDLDGITADVLQELVGTVPVRTCLRSDLAAGIPVIELLVRTVSDSKGSARRLVTQGGAYINNKKITDANQLITTEHLITPTMLVVRAGKKDYCLVELTDEVTPETAKVS